MAANRQVQRAKELKELIQLSEEENFNLFEMVPQTPQDMYFSKLAAGVVKTQVTSCLDDMVEREVQTDELTTQDKSN